MQTDRAKRWLLVGGTITLGFAAALLLEYLHRVDAPFAFTSKSSIGGGSWATNSRLGFRAANQLGAPTSAKKNPPPWEASENQPPPGAGYVPAWVVKPPKPDESAPQPLPPVPPPDPATHRPPMDNPGGVNGTRPPRPVPGVE